jgi:Rps23 Pro-64 3,4-dihydroxylase Tpa1-like proline 4-hydroxylase
MSSAKGRKAPAKGKKDKPTEEEEDMRIREEHRAAREWLATLSPRDVLSSDLFDAARIEQLRTEFRAKTPFPHSCIENFVDDQFLTAMLEELKTLDYSEKNNDLYAFSQSTEDLKCVTSPLISRFRELLYSPAICKALSTISGIELFGLENTASQPDFFAAVYSDRSRLLCHDDELEGRRIAFIVYLVPEGWCDADGGHLDLFNTDPATGAPSDIAVSHVPKRASFLFFEVSPQSYHQVREVLSSNKLRVSMGGWFHGPPITRKPPMVEVAAAAEASEPVPVADAGSSDMQVQSWVNKQYLAPKVAAQIRSAFEDDSSVELHNFFDAKVFKELLAEVTELEGKAFPAPAPASTAATAATAATTAESGDDDDNDDHEDDESDDDAAEPAAMGDTDADADATGSGKKAAKSKAKGKSKSKKATVGGKRKGAKKGGKKGGKAKTGATGVVLPALIVDPAPGLGVVRAGPANFRCFYEHAGAGEPLQFAAAGECGPAPSQTPRLDALVRFMRTERFSEVPFSLSPLHYEKLYFVFYARTCMAGDVSLVFYPFFSLILSSSRA